MWWEHKECDNDFTRYILESIDYSGVRVLMRGREEGGWDKDCGAHLKYEVNVFEIVTSEEVVASDWFNIRIGEAVSYPTGTRFARIEVRTPDGKIGNIDLDPLLSAVFDATVDDLTNTMYITFP
jgi:hypothetical protein